MVELVRWPSGTGTAEEYIAGTAPRGWDSKLECYGLSEENIAALRADLERVQREKEAKKREYEAKLERLRRERSLGTSFDGQGGGNSADRRGTAASTMSPMLTSGVSAGGGLGEGCRMFLGILYRNSPWNALPTYTSLGSDVLRFL